MTMYFLIVSFMSLFLKPHALWMSLFVVKIKNLHVMLGIVKYFNNNKWFSSKITLTII